MKRSDTEIENILNSLTGISQAKARPFMYTRVLARLQEENNFWGRVAGFLTKPAIAFACLSAILVANIYTILNVDPNEQQETTVVASNITSDILQNDTYILAVTDVNQ